MMTFITVAKWMGLAMLVWNCIEVGRNDATNIVSGVFGARILSQRKAIILAALATVAGALAATPVMETARRGIFEPSALTIDQAITVYVSAYLVNTVLLYTYSTFGLPVSSSACLVFELVGAALGLGGLGVVFWGKVSEVTFAILVSIFMTGALSFIIQRAFRGAIRDKIEDRETILSHGPWIAGVMLTWLTWFMLVKGLKNVEAVVYLQEHMINVYGATIVLMLVWCAWTFAVHLFLVLTGTWGSTRLFPLLAVTGMLCMGFAFGQNDMANCAAPGLSALYLWQHSEQSVAASTNLEISGWWLLLCGCMMPVGMFTARAQRVIRAAVNTGSQYNHVALYAPQWCQGLARQLLRFQPPEPELAPPPTLTPEGKKVHYDALRAAVIMAVSASAIALASGLGLPVSTTYVAFAAILGTGFSDRVMSRGDADLKLGRAIWVVTGWLLSAVVALLAGALAVNIICWLGTWGLFLALALNLGTLLVSRKCSDEQEERVHGKHEAREQGHAGSGQTGAD